MVRFIPPLNVTPEEMDEALDIFADALADKGRPLGRVQLKHRQAC